MKFVIFSDRSYNYIRPISEGLAKRLCELDHDVSIYYDGIYWLSDLNLFRVFFIDIYRFILNLIKRNSKLYIYRFFKLLTFFTKKKNHELLEADCIIVVINCPGSFYKNNIRRVEELRIKYNKPIVCYDFHYLPNQGWYKRILDSNPENYGLERFDWYLTGSIVTEYAIPKQIPIIYSNIGFNIKSANLYPEQKKFMALLDFRRNGYDVERDLIINVLTALNIPFVELSGRYTSDEIRSIYRKSSIYFISCRESFGLPILELQLCGCYIFTPYREWAPAHFLDKSIYEKGVGKLGRNFVVYDNNEAELINYINEIKINYNPLDVIHNFKLDYPYYYDFNNEELINFINLLQSRKINSNSHFQYKDFNKYISLSDNVILYDK